MNDCKWLYADWCHKPSRCQDYQEKCIDYLSGKCPDYEDKSKDKRENVRDKLNIGEVLDYINIPYKNVQQELIQKCETVMNRNYCNGVSINQDSISESNKDIKFHIDYSVPRKILEGDSEQIFYIKLKNVGLIRLSKKGEVLGHSSAEDFIQESIQSYKEIFEKKEKH